MPFVERSSHSPRVAESDHSRHANLPVVAVKLPTLPSKGVGYPEHTEIEFRPYTFGEVKRMVQSIVSGVAMLDMALEGVAVKVGGKSQSTDMLTMADAHYIALLRRVSSLGGESFNLKAICPKCRGTASRGMKTAEISFVDMTCPKLPVVVTLQDKQRTFYPYRVLDQKILTRKDPKLLNDPVAIMAVMERLPVEKLDEEIKFLEALHGEEILVLEKVDEVLYHGVDEVEVTCNVPTPESTKEKPVICGHKFTVDPDEEAGEVLLQPFRVSEEAVSARIGFGLPTA